MNSGIFNDINFEEVNDIIGFTMVGKFVEDNGKYKLYLKTQNNKNYPYYGLTIKDDDNVISLFFLDEGTEFVVNDIEQNKKYQVITHYEKTVLNASFYLEIINGLPMIYYNYTGEISHMNEKNKDIDEYAYEKIEFENINDKFVYYELKLDNCTGGGFKTLHA
jgi:hypothetical protein